MATIVRQYDPWREKAAVNLISGLISGLLQRNWQNEDNRKMNAFRGEVLSELDRRRGATPQLQGQQTLGDYSGNTWARASQPITDSALSQFDALAEEDNLPKYDISKTGAVPIQSLQSPITIQDMQDAIARTLAAQPRRWARLSDQAIQAEFLPYMQAMEQGRQEQLRNNLADSYGQAQDAAAKRDVLMRGAISGFIPESMAAQGQNVYQYDNPQPQMWTQNDGKNIHMGTFTPNPNNPSIIDTIQMANFLTPQQTADNSYRYAQLGETAREFNKDYALNVRKQNAVEDETKYNRDNPKLDTITARDGTIYLINTRTGNVTEVKKPDGEVIKINPKASDVILKEDGNGNYFMFDRSTGRAFAVTDEDGNQVTAPQRGTAANSANKDMTDSQKKNYDTLNTELKEMRKNRDKYQDAIDMFSDEPNSIEYKNALKGLNRCIERINEIKAELKKITNGTSAQPASSSTLPPPKNRRAAVSSDIPANTASADVRGTAPASNNVQPTTVSSNNAKTNPNAKVEYFNMNDLPQDMFYDTVRDKDIPQDNILTPQQLVDIIQGIRQKFPQETSHLTPLTIAYQLYKYKGYRIRRG